MPWTSYPLPSSNFGEVRAVLAGDAGDERLVARPVGGGGGTGGSGGVARVPRHAVVTSVSFGRRREGRRDVFRPSPSGRKGYIGGRSRAMSPVSRESYRDKTAPLDAIRVSQCFWRPRPLPPRVPAAFTTDGRPSRTRTHPSARPRSGRAIAVTSVRPPYPGRGVTFLLRYNSRGAPPSLRPPADPLTFAFVASGSEQVFARRLVIAGPRGTSSPRGERARARGPPGGPRKRRETPRKIPRKPPCTSSSRGTRRRCSRFSASC